MAFQAPRRLEVKGGSEKNEGLALRCSGLLALESEEQGPDLHFSQPNAWAVRTGDQHEASGCESSRRAWAGCARRRAAQSSPALGAARARGNRWRQCCRPRRRPGQHRPIRTRSAIRQLLWRPPPRPHFHITTDTPRSRFAERGAELCARLRAQPLSPVEGAEISRTSRPLPDSPSVRTPCVPLLPAVVARE